VRSPAIARWYLEDGSLRPCLDGEGWYHTGDRGWFGDDGRLQLRGRVRAPIVLGGIAVCPETVEAAIAAHPGVLDVVVVPARTSEGDVVSKAIVVAPGLTEDDLRQWGAVHLDPNDVPSIVEIRERLPYSPAGKLLLKYI
jgi:acyl-CoA synthetase (AMP-forming)/AMP-acid ligase II